MRDSRLYVKHITEKWKGRLTAMLGSGRCSVQRDGHEFYRVCHMDDLEPVDEGADARTR